MKFRMHVMTWVLGFTAVACLGGGAQAAKVTYSGAATIITSTSGIPFTGTDLGFTTGTELQGMEINFEIMFNDDAFDPDSIAGLDAGRYSYNGASSYNYQIAGGNLVSKQLDFILTVPGDGSSFGDNWNMESNNAGGSLGRLQFDSLPGTMVLNDDSLQTLLDPADFDKATRFNIFVEGSGPAIFADLDALFVTTRPDDSVVPTPAAAGAGLVLLGGLWTRRERRRGR